MPDLKPLGVTKTKKPKKGDAPQPQDAPPQGPPPPPPGNEPPVGP